MLVAPRFTTFFTVWLWEIFFFMILNSHCDWIHGYGGNCVHNVAAITQIEITWKQCFLYLFPLKRDFFVFSLLSPSLQLGFTFRSSPLRQTDAVKDTCTLSCRCSSLSLIALSFNRTFAPLLPSSPPCLSWLCSPHLFSVTLQICRILLAFLPSVNIVNSLSGKKKQNKYFFFRTY